MVKTSHILHNKYRRKTGESSFKTFDGNMNCGGLSYLLNYYLKKHDYYSTLTIKHQKDSSTPVVHIVI